MIVFRDVCSGMKYLEMKKIVHLHLSAKNVLLDGDLNAKVRFEKGAFLLSLKFVLSEIVV